MEWKTLLALIIAIPIILFPVVFIWFINLGGLYSAIKKARARKKAVVDERIGNTAKAR